MGPSGCGKTTLLNVLAHRAAAASGAETTGLTLVDGAAVSSKAFRQMSSYVEQEDALIGSLTVKETMEFAARLGSARWVPSCPIISYLIGHANLLSSIANCRKQREEIV